MTRHRLALSVVVGALAVSPALAGEDKWGAHLDLEGKPGSKRHLGEADLFVPLTQDAANLLFADIRTRLDDNGSREGNFGLGVRRMLESGWNVGGYGFFDRRRSSYHNYFNQATAGAEALSSDWDVRVNGYVPVGRTTYQEESLNTAELSGGSVVFRGGEERALGGFDAEIGWRTPLFSADDDRQWRLFAGGYRFADEGVPIVAGPRVRTEMVFDELPELWPGARLALGAEWQSDNPRGSQGFLSARLRIPLQEESASASRLTPMERRMTDPIVRDVDIVAQAGAYGATETATQTSDGNTLSVVSSATTTTAAALNTALTTAGANSTVILSGSFSTGDTTIALQSGQTVMGSGSVTVKSPSGRTATLSNASTATISATRTTQGAAVNMANNSTVKGMTITPTNGAVVGAYGIQADGVTGVTIANNTITVNMSNETGIGIRLVTSASGTLSGNTVTVSNSNGNAYALQINTSTATINGNSLSAGANMTQYAVLNATATLSGSGNTLAVTGSGVTSSLCKTSGTTGTSFTYGSGSTCGDVNN